MIFYRTLGGLNFSRLEKSNTIINVLETDYKQESLTGNSNTPSPCEGVYGERTSQQLLSSLKSWLHIFLLGCSISEVHSYPSSGELVYTQRKQKLFISTMLFCFIIESIWRGNSLAWL